MIKHNGGDTVGGHNNCKSSNFHFLKYPYDDETIRDKNSSYLLGFSNDIQERFSI